MAVVFLFTGFRYTTVVLGEAHQIPTFTRGAVQALDDTLAALMKAKSESGPQ